MFKPEMGVRSPSGLLRRKGLTGELPAIDGGESPQEARAAKAPNRPSPGPSATTQDGFAGSRDWQAAIDRMASGLTRGPVDAPVGEPTPAPRPLPQAAEPNPAEPPPAFRRGTAQQIQATFIYGGGGHPMADVPEDLAKRLGGDGQALRALELLLFRGIAERMDSRGNRVIDHLRAILDMPVVAGRPSPLQVARELMDGLLSPHSIQQGQGTFSCTAATIQGILASTNPGEYMRVVRGLVFEGEVQTQGGDVLKADLRGLKVDEGRNVTEDIFQESVMAFGKAMGDGGGTRTYGNGSYGSGSTPRTPAQSPASGAAQPKAPPQAPASGSKAGAVTPPPQRRWGSEQGGGHDGLTSAQFTGIVQSLTGQKSAAMEPSDGFTRQAMLAILGELLHNGPVAVGIAGTDKEGMPTMHAVRVTASANGVITFEDSGTGESKTTPVDDFHSRLKMIMVPFEEYDRLTSLGLSTGLRTMPSGGGGGGGGGLVGPSAGRMALK